MDHPAPLAVRFTHLTWGDRNVIGWWRTLESGDWQARVDQAAALADADRAARLAGHKPLFRRLLERLRPPGEGPGSDPQNFPGTPSDRGR
jgi:hypothetical protein